MKALGDDQTLARLQRIGDMLTDEPVTYRCPDCTDLGYELRDDEFHQVWASPCRRCEKGQAILGGISRSEAFAINQAQKAQDRIRARSKPADDDLPF